MTVQILLYPILVFILIIFLLLTVPRQSLRALMPYGVVLGGLLDFACNLIFGNLFKIFSFHPVDFLTAGEHLLLTPIAWACLVIFYLYFWPTKNQRLGFFYGFAWAILATGFSQIVYQVGLFRYQNWFYPFPMLLMFLARFAIITWIVKPWLADWQ